MMTARMWLRLLVSLVALLLPSAAQAALVTLTGQVTDVNGIGIFGVQINFVDSCTGVTAGALNNTTSTTGQFQATVTAGVYDLEFFPPSGSLFTADRIKSFDLTTSKTLVPNPLALPYGITVSGRVTDTAGVAISGVYLHFFPPGSTERVFTVRDRTDASGNYSVVVAPGTYDLHYGPPLGTRYLTLAQSSVPIPGNTTLPTVALKTGLLVSGTVYDTAGAGHPVINVNIDALDATTGLEIPLSHDRTDSTGTYTVAVPAGSLTFEYKPEKCTLLVAQASAPTTVSADVTLPRVSLTPGVLVKGMVTDVRGAPINDVNTNYFDSLGTQVLTWNDHTDTTGAYSAVVPPGTYSIEYIPPVGLRLAGVKLTGVIISNNPPPLPTVQLPDGFFVTGRNVTLSGAPVYNVDLAFFAAGSTTNRIYVSHHHTDTAGNFTCVVVPGSYDIRFEPPTTSLAARRLFGISVSGTDVRLGDILLEQGYVVTGRVTDSAGLPVVNADLDFYDFYTGVKVETPHDNTDTNGDYIAVVPPRLYNVSFVPVSTDLLETGRISGIVITANLSGLNIVLRDAFIVSGTVRDAASQPVANVDLNFYQSGTGIRQTVSRDNTALDGTYAVLVPPGTYHILFTPPTGSMLALGTVQGVVVQGDIGLPDVVLAQALAASVASITPTSGPSSGGTAVTILGSNFQPGALVTLGGLNLSNVQVTSPGQINAMTPAYPVGSAGAVVDLAVTNVGSPAAATLPAAFTFVPAATPVSLTIMRSAPNIDLSWPSTGQASYTIYRSTSPSLFGQAQVLAVTTATTFIDVGGDADGLNYFYRVE